MPTIKLNCGLGSTYGRLKSQTRWLTLVGWYGGGMFNLRTLKRRGTKPVQFCINKQLHVSTCKVTTHLLGLFLVMTGLSWIMPEKTLALLSSWQSGGSLNQKRRWSISSSCIWWVKCRERILRCSKNKGNLIQKIN